jgi:hypothetical protein
LPRGRSSGCRHSIAQVLADLMAFSASDVTPKPSISSGDGLRF